MKTFLLASIIFLSACTSTHVLRTDGEKVFEASNISIGWDRENVNLELTKPDNTHVAIGIGSSKGSTGLDGAITGLETTLDQLKLMRP